MPVVTFDNHHFEIAEGDSVLDTLIKHGMDVSYSCRSGVCQTCMMRCVQGSVPAAAQVQLKPNLQSQGYFLACQCQPVEDMHVEQAGSAQALIRATLIEKQALSPTVWRLRLQTAETLDYQAGQFVNVRREDGLTRSYSLASLPAEDDFIELHIKRMDNGAMSNWLADDFGPGNSVDIEGPHGSCFYTGSMQGKPLLLVGTGTGMAPLYGIIKDALKNKHSGPIVVYHGAYSQDELYLDDTLRAMVSETTDLSYHSCITADMPAENIKQGMACEQALIDNPNLAGWQVFLCGSPAMVKRMQQKTYLAGAAMHDIHTDPFETQYKK